MVIAVFSAVATTTQTSDNYAIPLSAITCGGGAAETSVYNHPQSAIGQAGVCGVASSDSYIMRTGVVQVRYSIKGPHIQGWITY